MSQYFYGHPIKWVEYDDESSEPFYVDNDEPCWRVPFRPCPKCRLTPEVEEPGVNSGHDPCIANLPGVDYACCGHGVEQGYIKFKDGRIFRFDNLHVSTSQPHPLLTEEE